ncbi:MAG: protein kinase [Myxococcales bacterium]|nr:protein kinase [Myxococcales bacterium]
MSESSASPKASSFDRVWKTLGYEASSSIALGETIRPEAREAPPPVMSAPDAPQVLSAPDAPQVLSAPDAPAGNAALPAIVIASGPGAPGELLVKSRLGAGGMGAVDLAEQRSLGREVAIKRLHEETHEALHVAALLQEARTLGRLEHPGIVPVYALGLDRDARPVVVMKRVSGVSFSALIDDRAHPFWATLLEDGRDRIEVIVDVMMQACNALSYAHAQGVVHRDIKPDNIMIGAFGVVYVLDWGVALDRRALATQPSSERQIVGTPVFMAPELFDGAVSSHDERTDVYLFGATLHYALTGRAKHEGATLYEALANAYVSAPFAYGEDVPAELGALCNECTSREPSARPASFEKVRRRLVEYLHHRGSTAIARRATQALERARAARDEIEQRRLLTEARLGFVQALADWPENSLAKRGYRATLDAIVDRELESRNATAARAAVTELGDAGGAIVARIELLERELERERAEAEAGRRHEREMDVSVGANVRAAMGVLGFLVLLGFSALFVVVQPSGARAALGLVLAQDVAAIAFFVLIATVLRRRLFGNTVSSRLAWAFLALLLCGAAVDGVAWLARADIYAMASFKFVAIGFVLLTTAITVERLLGLAAAVAIVAAFVMAKWPSTVENLGSVASVALLVIFVWVARRSARRAGPPTLA